MRRPPLAAALLALAACAPPETRGRSAVLITMDTTRVEALGCYGTPQAQTPNLDRLAAQGVRFEWARSVAPLTLPAHASMLTGLYPLRHGVRDNTPTPLPDAATTVAELAQAAGVETAAFVAAVVLDSRFGLNRGFDVYRQPRRDASSSLASFQDLPAAEVSAAARAWLAGREDPARPFFLWVHFFDPHAPYAPPPAFSGVAGGDPYLGEVAAMDAAIGELVEDLRARRLLGETLVVAVADHGEALGQHGERTHGTLCYDSTMRVPLIVRRPGGRRGGTVSSATVSIVDVFPTLLRALGLATPAGVDGIDLLDGVDRPQRGVYFESYAGYLNYGWGTITGWADASGKYIHDRPPEIYDTRSDPLEVRNLLASPPAPIPVYREAIAALSALPRLEADAMVEMDEELVVRLHALGYAAGADASSDLPEPLEISARPSPRDRLSELARFLDATAHGDAGRFEQAIELLREVVADNPRNVLALDLLGFYLGRSQRWAEEADVLRKRLLFPPEKAETHMNLGSALHQMGELDASATHIQRALELDPDLETAREALRRVRAEIEAR